MTTTTKAGDRRMMASVRPVIRAFRPEDTPGVVATVREVFDEYGFSWDEAGYNADLYDVEKAYTRPGGRFWTVEWKGEIVGCVGLAFHQKVAGSPGGLTLVDGVPRVAGTDSELVRLYVRPRARGLGLGKRLSALVAETAHRDGATALEIWSDKKLEHAHRLYGSLGAIQVGERVCPGDPDQSWEWGFCLPLPLRTDGKTGAGPAIAEPDYD